MPYHSLKFCKNPSAKLKMLNKSIRLAGMTFQFSMAFTGAVAISGCATHGSNPSEVFRIPAIEAGEVLVFVGATDGALC
jgi:hypothetical protein